MRVERRLLPKQWEFVRATERHVLQSAGFGTGKTFGLDAKLMARASVKGAREGLTRKTLVSLKASTLKTLLDGDGDVPPMLPPSMYTHNKADKIIRIKGGGEIIYFGLDDPNNLGSYNLTGCAVDEANQLTLRDWQWVCGRVRVPIAGLPNQVYAATNPGPPSHWLVEPFGLALGHKAKEGYRVVRSTPEDNHHLPAEYIANLKAMSGVAYKRFYLGEWAGADGLVYDNFNRDIHVAKRHGPWARSFLAIDEGFTNPFVCLLVHVDGDGRFHVEREAYKRKLTRDPKRALVREMADSGVEAVLIDPSAAELIEVLSGDGHSVVPADNEILPGIHRLRARLDPQGDGKPRLTIDPSCEELLREFESYEYPPDSDKPRKEFDHGMDALRYLASHLEGPTPRIVVTGGDTPYSVASEAERLFGDDGWTVF